MNKDNYKSNIDHVLDMLHALGIVSITYMLSGGGDSGEATLESVKYADGREETSLPDVPIGFSHAGDVLDLDTYLTEFAAEYPEIDWVNNEGGGGPVTFLPGGEEGERIESCVEQHEDYDEYDDDDDDDDEEDSEDDAGQEAALSYVDDDTPVFIEEKA